MDIKMNIINKKHSPDNIFFSILLLLFSIGWFIMLFSFIFFMITNYQIHQALNRLFEFILLGVIPGYIVGLLFLDLAIYRLFGKEVIEIRDVKLIIRKKNRIINRTKKITLNKIRNIEIWKTKNYLLNIEEMLAFWEITKAGTLCIHYSKNRKYYVGANLSKQEAEQMKNEIEKLISSYSPCSPEVVNEE